MSEQSYHSRHSSNSSLNSFGSPNPSPNTGRCIYGFVLFLVSIVMVLLYLFYAIIPSKLLKTIGFTYFDRKYWSIALPTQILLSIFVFTVCLYPSLNYLFTKSLNHSSVLFDKNSHSFSHSSSHSSSHSAIPPIQDLKPQEVSLKLYL